VGENQDCRKAERQSAVCEKELESSPPPPPPSHGNDTESFSSPSSLSLSDSVESSLKVEVPLKKEPVSGKEQQGEDQLSTKVKPVIVTVSSLKTEPESTEVIKEEASPKEESKMMKRKSTQSFIPRSCKQPNGASPEEESSPLRGSSSSHLPILVAKSSIDNCSTHSQEGEKQLSKIPTVGPAKHVKSNSPKTHTSRLPKKSEKCKITDQIQTHNI
jgi:hypothetical protein